MNDEIKQNLQKSLDRLEITATRAVCQMTFAPCANIKINGLPLELLEDIRNLGAEKMFFEHMVNNLSK